MIDPQAIRSGRVGFLVGEYQIALEFMGMYREEYGQNYVRRLAALLTPQGER